jgi:DNA gyrase subunit A
LTGLEIDKLEAEFQALVAEIADLNDILAREIRVTNIIKTDLDDIEQLYGDDRRTEISPEEIDGSFDMEELIAEEMMVVTVTRDGWIKRTPLDQYRAQRRGGQGVKGSEAKEGDVTRSVFAAATKDYLMFFTNQGKVHWAKVWTMPEAARDGKGRPIANLVQLETGEKVQSVLRVPHFDKDSYVFFATRLGTVKKTSMALFARPKRGGIRAISIAEGDELVGVAQVKKGETILLSSAVGKTIRFHETSVRSMGRTAGGVRGLRLLGDDRLVGLVVASSDDCAVLSACEKGYGKRTPIAEYPIKGRGGQGVMDIKTTDRNGKVVATALVRDGDELLFVTTGGKAVRIEAAGINAIGRNTQGVRLVDLRDGDYLAGLDVVSEADLDRYVAERAAAGPMEALPDLSDEAGDDEGDDLTDDQVDDGADDGADDAEGDE